MNVATTNLYIFLNASRNRLKLINLKIILDTKITAMATSLLQRLFVSNGSDEVASNEEQEVTTSNNGQETETKMTLTQELYAFFANGKNEEEQCNNVSSRVVQKDMMLYEITKRRSSNLEKLYAALKTIKSTSVEAERAFSTLGYFVSKIRNCLKRILLMLCCF